MVYVQEEEEKEKEDLAVWWVAGGRLWLCPRPPTESPGPRTCQGPLSPLPLSAAITPMYQPRTKTTLILGRTTDNLHPLALFEKII